jgi:hypothetical protein
MQITKRQAGAAVEGNRVDRRKFVKLAGIGCALAAVPTLVKLGVRTSGADAVFFHVAGARFYGVKKDLKTGIRVKVVRETFRGTNCYAICADGTMIGYVPKRLVPIIGRSGIESACLSSVDTYAVPWRRYGVTLRTLKSVTIMEAC